ncbi:hypothetical protein Asppvi_003467 [Aspergillus pseudoviridinutans]|uniref:DUF7587 domain-containing protein n=1 Tax=Aspergillus pseudoviridinutans TaxID=1517512 RepID=A0A9P3BA23_9EURO|nr:uncharacterized protein Asppvi_003467 [Aspergillus pseudoviridinutans]GIJ84618.1 hypothetical protein Asppvi_003467 [Aspergillus pseudoviridinutans]
MAYKRFYRVTSDTSAVKYENGVGFVAGDTTCVRSLSPRTYSEKREAKEQFERHMDWGNRELTPFISAYSLKSRAEEEAERRAEGDEDDVVLWTIEVERSERSVQWEEAFVLEHELQAQIPHQGLHNAEHEVLFLHEIPRRLVVKGTKFIWKHGGIWVKDFPIRNRN